MVNGEKRVAKGKTRLLDETARFKKKKRGRAHATMSRLAKDGLP